MKAHITKQETKLREVLNDNFRKVRQAGLMNGAAAVAGVIYKIATKENTSDTDKLKEITDFCQRSLALKEKLDDKNE